MIVGLKRRAKSKKFYDLAVLDMTYEKSETETKYRKSSVEVTRNYKGWAVVETFNGQRTRYGYNFGGWRTVRLDLMEKICDEDMPSRCKNEECQYRFRCYTSKTNVEDRP
jgi:hypothetical protein